MAWKGEINLLSEMHGMSQLSLGVYDIHITVARAAGKSLFETWADRKGCGLYRLASDILTLLQFCLHLR